MNGGAVALAVGLNIAILNGIVGRFSKSGQTMTEIVAEKLGAN